MRRSGAAIAGSYPGTRKHAREDEDGRERFACPCLLHPLHDLCQGPLPLRPVFVLVAVHENGLRANATVTLCELLLWREPASPEPQRRTCIALMMLPTIG